MSELDISSNNLVSEHTIMEANSHKKGDLVEHEGVQCPVTFVTASGYKILQLHGIRALAEAIKEDNGALVNLNVSNNGLGPEGAQALVPAM